MAKLSLPRKKSDLAARSTTPGFHNRRSTICLAEAGLSPEQLDYVGFYDKPLLKFERLLETYLAYAPLASVRF